MFSSKDFVSFNNKKHGRPGLFTIYVLELQLATKEKDVDLVLREGSDPKCGCSLARNLVVFKHHSLVGMF